ncbi:MAG: hypothetical protein QXW76_04075 [Candidatus Korarchaeum sp.]
MLESVAKVSEAKQVAALGGEVMAANPTVSESRSYLSSARGREVR